MYHTSIIFHNYDVIPLHYHLYDKIIKINDNHYHTKNNDKEKNQNY